MTNCDIVSLMLTFDHIGSLDLVQASHLGLKAYTLAQTAGMAALDIVIVAITGLHQSNRQTDLLIQAAS